MNVGAFKSAYVNFNDITYCCGGLKKSDLIQAAKIEKEYEGLKKEI